MHKKDVPIPVRKLSSAAIAAFLVSVLLCSFLLTVAVIHRTDLEKSRMENLISQQSFLINDAVSRLLYKTESLSALVKYGNGTVEHFHEAAEFIIANESAIINVLLAPSGIVTYVHPLEGNEAIIGLDYLNTRGHTGNREAIQAVETGELVMGGPFMMAQGRSGLVGRLPVYLDAEDGDQRFWGLVSVTLKFPEVLQEAALSMLEAQDISYEIWRIDPDTREKQVIANNPGFSGARGISAERQIEILNARWNLVITSNYRWYNYFDNVVIIVAGILISCLVLFVAQRNYELKKMSDSLKLAKESIEAYADEIVTGLNYASTIQKDLLPPESRFNSAFSEHSIIWEPMHIVSGDIYWLKNFDDGAILCVCDCTGHGTPGALLTMLVASAFETIVSESNYKDTAEIVRKLEKRLQNVNDGCDFAILFISNDGAVSASAGNMSIFTCNGENVTRHKGQRIHIGEGRIKTKEDVKVITIPPDPRNKFYIASDGLFEQLGGENNMPFGYDALTDIILSNHNEGLNTITNQIWNAFLTHLGDNTKRDDVELIAFRK